MRRQAWSEQAQQFTQLDAVEQRITALYVAATEQLGSDKAAVRLAGLYALERLGQDNSKLRQVVVEVWCAYLRMPYTPPTEVLRRNVKGSPQYAAPDAEAPKLEDDQQRREELQVRLTAQRLIAKHLRMSDKPDDSEQATYWRDTASERMSVDLVGANLVDFTLASCHAHQLNAESAQFHGVADLTSAQFHGDVNLRLAHFHSKAELREVQFHRYADFSAAHFHGHTDLSEAHFYYGTNARAAKFCGDASLHGVQFYGYAYLFGVQFHGNVNLCSTQFHDDANLGGAEFQGKFTHIDGSAFYKNADLRMAIFGRNAGLSSTKFYGEVNLRDAAFHGYADLRGTQFYEDADLRAQFLRGVDMSGARATSTVHLPSGWTLADGASTKCELHQVVRTEAKAGGGSTLPLHLPIRRRISPDVKNSPNRRWAGMSRVARLGADDVVHLGRRPAGARRTRW
ncbi:hypothetical protein GCM10027614_41290 [Micromonospora vulcania]